MPELGLDFHGVSVLVSGDVPGVLHALNRDFEYFLAPGAATVSSCIRLMLELRAPPPLPDRRPLFRFRDYAVFDRDGIRRIVYRDQAYAEYDFTAKRGRICCMVPERLHELAYLTVLSRAGEELDRRGFHRVHALGFGGNGKGGLLLLPSGAGKSILALQLLRSTALGLISDDTPVISRDLRLMAFPLRLGFNSDTDLSDVPERCLRLMSRRHYGLKRLVDLGFFRERVQNSLPITWLLLGQRQDGAVPRIASVSRLRVAAALAVHLVVGVGIAQMSEYMLRPAPSQLIKLLAIAASRLWMGLRLLSAINPKRFILSSDPKANAAALEAFLGTLTSKVDS